MKQTGFITPLMVEAVDAENWCLLEDFVWAGSQGDHFVVPAGSITDFASVPWWTQSILPRTGTWTKAAVMHDKMCDELNAYYSFGLAYPGRAFDGEPTFSAVDTDAIFRKNAREGGTDPIRSELLWMGVRLGALRNPARRGGWGKTAPRVIADVLGVVVVIYALVIACLVIGHAL